MDCRSNILVFDDHDYPWGRQSSSDLQLHYTRWNWLGVADGPRLDAAESILKAIRLFLSSDSEQIVINP